VRRLAFRAYRECWRGGASIAGPSTAKCRRPTPGPRRVASCPITAQKLSDTAGIVRCWARCASSNRPSSGLDRFAAGGDPAIAHTQLSRHRSRWIATPVARRSREAVPDARVLSLRARLAVLSQRTGTSAAPSQHAQGLASRRAYGRRESSGCNNSLIGSIPVDDAQGR
jgi:hypothetical protein